MNNILSSKTADLECEVGAKKKKRSTDMSIKSAKKKRLHLGEEDLSIENMGRGRILKWIDYCRFLDQKRGE